MAQTNLIQVRVDGEIKRQADALFADLGIDTPTAIRIFLAQALKQHGLPFAVTQYTPNADTIAAMEEANRINRDPNAKRYSSFADLLAEVQQDDI